jgi:hypothetical protein
MVSANLFTALASKMINHACMHACMFAYKGTKCVAVAASVVYMHVRACVKLTTPIPPPICTPPDREAASILWTSYYSLHACD